MKSATFNGLDLRRAVRLSICGKVDFGDGSADARKSGILPLRRQGGDVMLQCGNIFLTAAGTTLTLKARESRHRGLFELAKGFDTDKSVRAVRYRAYRP
ncbi:hypothetical protein ACN2XU_05150 [Primorskyibacter sp. 2E107]|uniref:hypothetical protein n=1 Tax=Primorskyibacter sp. 2E107 TaxID=3403458 RepID=UPI003AF95E55